MSRGSGERHVRQSHAIIGTPCDVPVPRKVTFTLWLDDAWLLLRLDETQPQIVDEVVEQLGFGWIEIAACLVLQQRQEIDHLCRGDKVRLTGLAAHGVGQVAKVDGGSGAERQHELREADA